MKKLSNYFRNALFILYFSLSVSSAFANPVTFTLKEGGVEKGSFTFNTDQLTSSVGSCCEGMQYTPDSSTGIWSGETVNFAAGSGFYSSKGNSWDGVASWIGVGPILGTDSAPIFNFGTYTGINIYTYEPSTLTIGSGPAAPAPLVGGGLLSALAALLALGMTWFARRGNVLA